MRPIVDNDHLIRLYDATTVSVDKLPYTPEMDAIVILYNSGRAKPATALQLYRALINLRKNGKLPQKNK